MFQDFKKSASNIAIGIVVATIATGCASSRQGGGLSDDELLGDVQFDPAKEVEKAELAFQDDVWEITQKCEELKDIYSAEGKERNQAKLEAEREELFSRRIKPSKRKKKMAPFLEHLDGHEAELTRIAAAIKAEHNNLKKLDASTSLYKVDTDDYTKCGTPERPGLVGERLFTY